ncbi:MAG TPA: DUF1631 domain-containing protein [Gammaproteobacteria bacterium]|nr:DUF1631 domain-containing protein [Gammaproteobacteria bacterium]
MNIIHMDEFGKSRKNPGPAEAARLLKECRRRASERLTASLTGMLDKVDDALFELAEKAESNAVQSLYFDAMREVRIKRQSIETGFKDNFEAGFDNETNGGRTAEAGELQDSELSLSLVETDELEESLAVTNMVGKINTASKEALGALDRRMGLLLNDPELKRCGNPVGPEVICNAFSDACQVIGSGVKVRLIILKLFDRYVVADLPPIYQELNQFLVESGVLPKIRLSVKRRPGMGAGPVQAPPQGEGGGGEGQYGWTDEADGPDQDVFAVLQQLLSRSTGGGMPLGGGMGGGMGGGGYGTGGGMGYGGAPGAAGGFGPGGVVGALTQLQHGQGGGIGAGGFGFGGVTGAGGATNVLRGLKSSEIGQSLSPTDDMTIDIVAMLFDYILDDKDIPDAMKALIGRLQIPVLKVVMLDRTFFARKSHPARRLVNRLAEAAIGWDADDDERLYKKMEALVQRVIDEFEDDVEIFSELLEEFEQFLEQEARLAEAQVQQSTKAMEDKERVVVAKSIAQEEVQRRAESEQLREVVRSFLATHWKNLLFVLCAKEGSDSESYRQAVETMDDLIWSVAPKQTAADRKRLVRLLPGLLMRLKEGMGMISVEPEVRDRFLSILADCHARAVNAAGRGAEDPETASPPAAGEADPAAREIGELTAGASTAEPVPAAGNPDMPMEDAGGASVGAIRELLQESGLEVEEITLQDEPDVADPEQADDDYLEQACNLAVGSWVEFLEEDGSTSRVRLTWISRVTGTYLFTNRKGLKARDMTLHGLAAELRRGSATPLEDVPLLDRAVGNLMDGLRRSAAG